jgi:hypothetical protein
MRFLSNKSRYKIRKIVIRIRYWLTKFLAASVAFLLIVYVSDIVTEKRSMPIFRTVFNADSFIISETLERFDLFLQVVKLLSLKLPVPKFFIPDPYLPNYSGYGSWINRNSRESIL